MTRHSFRVFIVIAVCCIHCIGCRTFRRDGASPDQLMLKKTEFSKPHFDSVSERELCLETAKAVSEKGHVNEAILLYEKAEKLSPNGEPFDLELAPLHAQAGNTGAAIERYRNAIANGKASPELFNNFAWTLIQSDQYAEATRAVERGLSLTDSSSSSIAERLRSTRAILLFKTGNREQAFEAFEDLYGIAAAYHNLAVLDLEHGRVDQAARQLELATQHPNCPAESVALHKTLQSQIAKTSDRDASVRSVQYETVQKGTENRPLRANRGFSQETGDFY